jgi:branched-chain amino acid transport system substrate-binding protein
LDTRSQKLSFALRVAFSYRPSDHQATLGAYVGEVALENGRGTMTNFKYIDGDAVLPDAEKVKALRPAAN